MTLMMKATLLSAIAALVVTVMIGQALAQSNPQPRQDTFKVENIVCRGCSVAVQKALEATAGVTQVKVTQQGTATVTYDPALIKAEALAQVIAQARHPHGLTFKATLLQ